MTNEVKKSCVVYTDRFLKSISKNYYKIVDKEGVAMANKWVRERFDSESVKQVAEFLNSKGVATAPKPKTVA